MDFVSLPLKRNALPLCTSFATSTDTHNFISPPVNIVEFYYQHDNNAFPLTSFSSFPLYHHFLPSFPLSLLFSSFSPSSSSSSTYPSICLTSLSTPLKLAKHCTIGMSYDPSEQLEHGGMIFPGRHVLGNYHPGEY